MIERARIVIIGGGIVGCSTAYHLSRLGWRDIVVLDQGPLFHNLGSTSHAPGLMFQHNNSKTVTTLARWAVETYLEAVPEATFQVGSLEIAHTAERWEELKRKRGNALAWGLPADLIGPDEVQRLVPIMRIDDLYGAFYVPSDCNVKGVALMQGLARAAGENGAAKFLPNSPATGIELRNGRVRAVRTPDGEIQTDLVVCAAGLWGPLVGRMAGVSVPLMPCQHLYVTTEPLPELSGETAELRHPVVRYQDKDLYFRQVGQAYGMGTYRHDPLLVPPDHLPQDDHPAIFPFTEQHFAESWAAGVHRMPAFANTRLASRFNGLFSFTPDGNSILGEVPQARGFWVAEAVWVTHAGGVGRALAEWLADGTPSLDLHELDANRFHAHALSPAYIEARANWQYVAVYDILHPNQQLTEPRGLRHAPYHQRLEALGAVFFESAGWERPQYFESSAALPAESSWPIRSGWAAQFWSPLIGREHLAARQRVGLFDLTAFTKLEVSGQGALAFLQHMASNQMDQSIGRITYTPMLTERGGIKCDLTVTRLAADRFLVVTGGSTGMHDLAWLRLHAPADDSVHIADITSARCALGVWGPRARNLLQSVSADDVSNAAFPYMTARTIHIGSVPVLALRISYAGELGWELYAATEYGLALWDLLWTAGQPLGVAVVGAGAFDSLRLEKGYRLWGNELHTEYNPYEAGLGFGVRLTKGDFLGREAALSLREQATRRLCCLTFDDRAVAIVGKEPVLDGERVLGYVTSANYGYCVDRSIAYAYLPLEQAREGARVEIYYFGRRYPATVTREPLYDPHNLRLKA